MLGFHKVKISTGKWEIEKQLKGESWVCGRRGHDDVTENCSTCVRLEDSIV